MNFYVITDTHFGHDKLIKEGHRPPGCELKMLKSLVPCKKEDVLICLGDVSFYDDEFWHNQIMDVCDAKKILVLGNHDRKSLEWYYKHGWDVVCNEFHMRRFGLRMVFTHCPIDIPHDSVNIHGHLHNVRENHFDDKRHFLLKMEHDYTMVNLRKLVRR